MNTTPRIASNAQAKRTRRFVIYYLNGNLRHFAPNGCSLPVRAFDEQDAVVQVFGAPAEAWDGNHFTKWGGKLRARIEEL